MASRYCQQLSSDTSNLCRIIATPELQTFVNYSTQYRQLKRRMTVSNVHFHASYTNHDIMTYFAQCPKVLYIKYSDQKQSTPSPKQELPKFLKGATPLFTSSHFPSSSPPEKTPEPWALQASHDTRIARAAQTWWWNAHEPLWSVSEDRWRRIANYT